MFGLVELIVDGVIKIYGRNTLVSLHDKHRKLYVIPGHTNNATLIHRLSSTFKRS